VPQQDGFAAQIWSTHGWQPAASASPVMHTGWAQPGAMQSARSHTVSTRPTHAGRRRCATREVGHAMLEEPAALDYLLRL